MPSPPRDRLHSLDQFRGYTVAGMFLVNFLGGFAAVHPLLKHHNTYCSYADTIMPQFFFAVGFAFRLAFLRHVEKVGAAQAYRQAIVRGFGLILVGVVVYHLDGKFPSWEALSKDGLGGFLSTAWRRSMFQALVHIGVTSLWVLPVIARSARTQIFWLAGSAALHVWLSASWWHEWLRANRVIDGGPLGFLTWTIPVLAGSSAVAVVPIMAEGTAIGGLVILRLLPHKAELGVDDRELLDVLAAHAASALLAARLFSERTRKLRTLEGLMGLLRPGATEGES